MTPEFSRQIFEKHSKITNFMKILAMRGEFFHAGGRTDSYDEANSRNFSKAPKN